MIPWSLWKCAWTAAACVAGVFGQSLPGNRTLSSFPSSSAANSTISASSSESASRISASGNSSNSALLCDQLQSSYWSASWSYKPTSYSTTVVTETYSYNQSSVSYTWECTSTCGTICYAGPKTAVSTSLNIETGVITETSSYGNSYPSPSPTCSVALSDCVDLWQSYSSESSTWSSSRWDITPAPSSLPSSPTSPICKTCGLNRCTIDPASVDLYYFPQTANVTRDMCASMPVEGWASRFPEYPNATYVPTTTGPYQVVDGHTFYAGNVYVSIGTASAHGGCGGAVGKTHYGSILTLASSDIQSMRGYPKNNIPWSFNYADFSTPIPYSAYYGMPSCEIRLPYCSVVFNDEYQPQLLMPAAIRQLDPEWATCSLGFFGFYDPPIALRSLINPIFSSSTSKPPVSAPAQTTKPPNDPPTQTTKPNPADPPSQGPTRTAPPNSQPTSPPNDPNNPNDPPSSDPGNSPSNNDPGKSPNNNPPGPITITAGPGTVVADPTSGIVLGPGTTLKPGDPPITISGTTLSLVPTGIIIMDPSRTRTVPFSSSSGKLTIIAGSQTLMADPFGIVIAPGTTLIPGDSPITIDGTTISMGPSGVVIVDPNGATRTMVFPTGMSGQGARELLLTLGNGQVVTATSANGQVVIDGVTLNPQHPVATLPGGQVVSLGPSGVMLGTGSAVSTAVFSDPSASETGAGVFTGAGSKLVIRWEGFLGIMVAAMLAV